MPSLKVYRLQRKCAISVISTIIIRVGTVGLPVGMVRPRNLTLVPRLRLASGGALSIAVLLPCYILRARHRPHQAPHRLSGEVAAEAPCVGEDLTAHVGMETT
jgi:hypothetical protein